MSGLRRRRGGDSVDASSVEGGVASDIATGEKYHSLRGNAFAAAERA